MQFHYAWYSINSLNSYFKNCKYIYITLGGLYIYTYIYKLSLIKIPKHPTPFSLPKHNPDW